MNFVTVEYFEGSDLDVVINSIETVRNFIEVVKLNDRHNIKRVIVNQDIEYENDSKIKRS